MFATLFLTAALAATPMQVLSKQDVKMSAEIGDYTYLVLDTQDTLLIPTLLISMNQDGDLQIANDSSTLTSTYTDAAGIQHTVTTDCRRFQTPQACADSHAGTLAKMRILFPPRTP